MYTDIILKAGQEEQQGIYSICFNRPGVLNAVSNTMIIETLDALNQILQKGDCRVLILTGSGDSFTVGADTTAAVQLQESDYNDYLARFGEMLRTIGDFPAPVIAMINGYSFGGGAEIACACDIRMGSEKAKFRFPGVSYGLVVSASSLSTIVSLPKAKELMFSSAIIDAEEAYRIGVLNQLVGAEELEAYTYNYALKIVKNSQAPVEKTKEVLNNLVGVPKAMRKTIEGEANAYLRENTDQRATFAAFTGKRKTNRDW
jgi:enoyl-CoA hydratase/carnithine racemase